MLGDLVDEKVFWTKKMDLKLVKFLEARRYIWDPKDHQYFSSRLKDKAYNEFANKTGYDLNARAVKERWNNIRSTFSNNLRKVEQSQEENMYVPCWHLWQPCQFLFEAKAHQKGDKNESIPIKAEPASEDEMLSLKLLTDKLASSQDDDDEDNKPLKASSQAVVPSLDCKSIVNGLVLALNHVKNGSNQECDSPYDTIGRFVTDKLSNLEPLSAARAAYEIMETLLLYNEFNPDNPNNKNCNVNELNHTI